MVSAGQHGGGIGARPAAKLDCPHVPPTACPAMTRRRGALTESDRAAWADYARHVAALPGRAPPALPIPAVPAPQAAPATPPAAAVHQAPRVPVRLAPRAHPLGVGDQPGGVDNSTWGKLRTGKIAPTRTLDLHGRTAQKRLRRARGLPAPGPRRPAAVRRGDHRARVRRGRRRDPAGAAAVAEPAAAAADGAGRHPSACRQPRGGAAAVAPPPPARPMTSNAGRTDEIPTTSGSCRIVGRLAPQGPAPGWRWRDLMLGWLRDASPAGRPA